MNEFPEDDDLDFSDEALYANYDAFKTLMDAGIARAEALKRTGLTEQMVRDLELEEEENDFRSDFKDEWDADDDDKEWGDDEDNWNDDDDNWDDDGGGGRGGAWDDGGSDYD